MRCAHTVNAVLQRAPWTTCPGAVDKCEQTFTGVALEAFPHAARERRLTARTSTIWRCWRRRTPWMMARLVYDVFVSDPVDGKRRAEIFRNGESVLGWYDANYTDCRARGAGRNETARYALLDRLTRTCAAGSSAGAALGESHCTRAYHPDGAGSPMPVACRPPATHSSRSVLRWRRGLARSRDFSDGTVQPLDDCGKSGTL